MGVQASEWDPNGEIQKSSQGGADIQMLVQSLRSRFPGEEGGPEVKMCSIYMHLSLDLGYVLVLLMVGSTRGV